MQALVDPREINISYIESWTSPVAPSTIYTAVYNTYPNSCRVCQVEDDANTFPVAEPLFWTDCPVDTVADLWYYNLDTFTVNKIINAPYPTT